MAVAVLFILPGCSEDSPRGRPEKVPVKGSTDAPVEITSQDIANKIIMDANLDIPIPPQGARFPPAIRQNMLRMLELANTQHSMDPKGKEALGFVKQRLEKRVKEFDRAQLWEHLIGFIDAHKILAPSSSKYNRLRDKAMVELRRPKISLRGIINHGEHQMATLDFYLPLTSEYFSEKLYVGDIKHGIKIVSIFGDNIGVTVEYLETADIYNVFLPSVK